MRVRAIVVAVVGAALSLSGRAAAEVVPLAELEKRAVERHALLSAGKARTRAAAADVRQAESAYQPHVGMSAKADVAPGRRLIPITQDGVDYNVQGAPALDRDNGKQTLRAFTPQLRTGVEFTLGMSLYDFGRTNALIAASRARHEASEAEQELSREQIVAGVRGAYLAWLSAHEVHRLSSNTSVDAERRSERTQALVQEGARPRGDLASVEADRLLSALEAERAVGDLDGTRLMLEQNVGEQLSTSAEPDLAVLDVELDPKLSPDPSLRVLVNQRRALEATARAHHKARMPVLSTAIGFGVYSQSSKREIDGREVLKFSTFPSYAAGLELAVPLWDGGSSRAAAEAADARADEVRIRLENAELERAQAVERAKKDIAHAEKRTKTAAALLAVCQTRVKDVEAGYEMGAMQFEQVQAARALLRRAETELVMARVARAEAVLRVSP